MLTHCNSPKMEFHRAGRREVVAAFDAGRVSSDGGVLLLAEADLETGMVARFADRFTDFRDADLTEHSVVDIIRQRIYGLCLGYEDLNDHDTLRDDALIAAAIGKADPTGESRKRQRDRGHPLAGKSTLNRLELTEANASSESRYKKIVAQDEAIEQFFVEEFIDRFGEDIPQRLVLDFDPTDIELHGNQEGKFFHGYYGHYCYLPLLVFCGEDLLMARLREANIDGCLGTVEALQTLVPQLRAQWPEVEIVLRADSGFAREAILSWCESNNVEYVIGLARNSRLVGLIEGAQEQARLLFAEKGVAARVFEDLIYRTKDTWSCERRVVAKAEQLPGKSNPRFVVTSYSPERYDTKTLYEKEYCGRGEMENRIKEHQLDLFGDRASCTPMRANQLRLWLSGLAYCLMTELRRTGLANTELASAQTKTIRVRLLKVGALVSVSFRRVKVALSSVFPLQKVFVQAVTQLRAAYPP